MRLTKEQWNHAMELHELSDLDMLVYLDTIITDDNGSVKDMVHNLRLLNSVLYSSSTEIEQRYNNLKDTLFHVIRPVTAKEIDWEECIKKAQDWLRDVITAANKAATEEMIALMCCSMYSGEDDMPYMK